LKDTLFAAADDTAAEINVIINTAWCLNNHINFCRVLETETSAETTITVIIRLGGRQWRQRLAVSCAHCMKTKKQALVLSEKSP